MRTRREHVDALTPVAVLTLATLAVVGAALFLAATLPLTAPAAGIPGAWLVAAVAVAGFAWAVQAADQVGDSDRRQRQVRAARYASGWTAVAA